MPQPAVRVGGRTWAALAAADSRERWAESSMPCSSAALALPSFRLATCTAGTSILPCGLGPHTAGAPHLCFRLATGPPCALREAVQRCTLQSASKQACQAPSAGGQSGVSGSAGSHLALQEADLRCLLGSRLQQLVTVGAHSAHLHTAARLRRVHGAVCGWG